MKADFSLVAAQSLGKAMPIPVIFTTVLIVATAEEPWIVGILSGVFVASNIALAIVLAKLSPTAEARYSPFIEGPARWLLALVFLPPIIWVASGSFPSWVIAIPGSLRPVSSSAPPRRARSFPMRCSSSPA